jgi:two-component system CheB/CheR fusion protein
MMNNLLSSQENGGVTIIPGKPQFFTVGIAASAGGLQACTGLLEAMPPGCGMAFVVILHLSPEHESNAAQLLQRATPMPVVQVSQAMLLESDHVYVIAPNKHLTIQDDHLVPSEFVSPPGVRIAADVFFRTLAETRQESAIAIVLSGTGTDGALGIRRVKEQGGFTFAQAPEDAEHDGMPNAAIESGSIDFVLPVAEIPSRLRQLQNSQHPTELTALLETLPGSLLEMPASNDVEADVQKIIAQLRMHTGHDFRHYKRPTMLRRIDRRLQVRGMSSLAAYAELLESDPREADTLLRDMLIGVTNFFRDRQAFDVLEKKILPDILANRRQNDPVRAWVAACSTGEEAYSLAMILCEQTASLGKSMPIQIFASDIDERAIATARAATYPSSIITDVAPERLQQHFNKEDDRYRVRKSVRDRVLFAPHNILRDPPFSRLDIVSCRNLLIYLNREMQTHLLEMFHFSLNPGGILFLGSSESADLASHLFIPLDKKHHIYQARALSRGRYPSSQGYPALRHPGMEAPQLPAKRQFSFAEVHQRVLAQHAPPSVIVNRDADIVYMSDRIGRFLRHVAGEPSRNLVSLVLPDLRVELRTALFQAVHSGMSVEARRVRLVRDGRTYFIHMTVRPFRDDAAGADLVLVLFDEVEQTMGDEAGAHGIKADTVLTQLEEELQRTKEQLQETIEQSEISNEELRASNEELQAINEELRSATEELETSREELQSVNEELSTVNYELKSKVEETGKVNDDLNNLIASADIATIFVDRGMRIKRYTPRVADLFNLIPSDIGRSLLDITHRLDYDDLTSDVTATFDTLRPVEREVRSTDGRYYIVRHFPYRTNEDAIEGAVMTFFDITRRREAEEQARAGEARMRLVADSMMDYAIMTLDGDGRVTSWSKGAERLYGYGEQEMTGQPGSAVFLPEDREADLLKAEMRIAREKGSTRSECWQQRKDGSRFFASGMMSLFSEGRRDGYARIVRDDTERIRLESRREAQLTREHEGRTSAELASTMRDQFMAIMSHELRNPLNLINMNAELLSRLQEVQQSPLGARAVNTIRTAVASQSRVISDLLDLSRLQTGKLMLAPENVDFGALVRRLVEACRLDPACSQRRIDVSGTDAPMWVHADPVRLEQVVQNLLDNAVKFSQAGGSIHLRLDEADGEARLEVVDDGKGIAPEFLPHVFDMYRQAQHGKGRANAGLGIGLSLVKQLVDLHHGKIEAESGGQGKGACFRIRLPSGAAMDAWQGKQTVPPGEHLKGMSVLLLDGDEEASHSLRYLLEYEGATVSVAHHADDALFRLRQNPADLVIVDPARLEVTGEAFLRQMRQLPQGSRMLAISLGGLGRAQDVQQALQEGFAAHLAKPVALDVLLPMLAGLMQQRENDS